MLFCFCVYKISDKFYNYLTVKYKKGNCEICFNNSKKILVYSCDKGCNIDKYCKTCLLSNDKKCPICKSKIDVFIH